MKTRFATRLTSSTVRDLIKTQMKVSELGEKYKVGQDKYTSYPPREECVME